MKKIDTLLARHGLQMDDLHVAGKSNAGQLLEAALHQGDLNKKTDEAFIQILKEASRGIDSPGRGILVNPIAGDLPVTDFDPFIRGAVRWMNALGIFSRGSCDGHGRRPASIFLEHYLTAKQIEQIKAACPQGVCAQINGKNLIFRYDGNQEKLLELAENLYRLWKSPGYLKNLQAEHFKGLLLEMLSIPGASGNERRFRDRLRNKLSRLTDYSYTDHKGNLLSYVTCGEGPTILLSAHMDTVKEIAEGREILEQGTILSSSEGILGADDRAGTAAILEVLSNIHRTNFNGTLKIAFTVEEEIGCCGSAEIDQDFIQDAYAAIVVDRRGKRDIVTSYAGFIPFCPDEYGQIFEHAGRLAGMDDWKITQGGLSDARVFAEYGIPSVNLSVGYQNEHRETETVDYLATFETVKLIESVLHHQLIGVRHQIIS